MKYLNDWEKSVKQQKGYSTIEKGTMLLSQPTRRGLKPFDPRLNF